MNIEVDKYYKILGVSHHATFHEIKKAYRIRARELHPDVNKSPNAHNEFILLTEGYEYLINLKTGKIYNQSGTNSYWHSIPLYALPFQIHHPASDDKCNKVLN